MRGPSRKIDELPSARSELAANPSGSVARVVDAGIARLSRQQGQPSKAR